LNRPFDELLHRLRISPELSAISLFFARVVDNSPRAADIPENRSSNRAPGAKG
jgi:hypothetical protein